MTHRKEIIEKNVAALMERLLRGADLTELQTLSDEHLETVDALDGLWLSELMCPDGSTSDPASTIPGATPAPVSGTSPITIRVPNWVLQAFREQSNSTGIPYQTLMNRALAAEGEAFLNSRV